MKLTYKQRIFFYFFILFALFAIGITLFEQDQEKKYKIQALEKELDNYTEIIHSFVNKEHVIDSGVNQLNSLVTLFPKDLRITIIDAKGKVMYDKNEDNQNVATYKNHLDRPELRKAVVYDFGTNVRKSTTTNQSYFYYAKYYDNKYFIRVALPYNVSLVNFLKADNLFIYFILIIFAFTLVLLNYVSNRFSNSISKLKDYIIYIHKNKKLPKNIHFPDDELGDIGNEIKIIFEESERSRGMLLLEREKLIQHMQNVEDGIGIFTSNYQKIHTNSHFVQYLNVILDVPDFNVESVFSDAIFLDIQNFLNTNRSSKIYLTQISKNGKIFSIKVIVFDDKSFEIRISDITISEKRKLLKQEITNNIAHELRTPVTSLRADRETLTEQNLSTEKQQQFLKRSYSQVIRLSDLIEEIGLITKMEEAPSRFNLDTINLYQLLNELRIDLIDSLSDNRIELFIEVDKKLIIRGNYTLLYAIFRNLIENSIAYGGDAIQIHIKNYMIDEKYVYFSFYDTGKGVEEKHLNRLFERFYRVNEGRTREDGGSGLGLSIVKNAVLFHKGNILAKNRIDGGLEFLFTLEKNL